MLNKKIKYQKPLDCDAHFKYKCPDPNCGFDHWLSLKESQTKNFKIVCDCGLVFRVKRIKKIKILYSEVKEDLSKNNPIKQSETIQQNLPSDLLQKGCETLIKYGFTKNESKELLIKAFQEQQTFDIVELIKLALIKVGEA